MTPENNISTLKNAAIASVIACVAMAVLASAQIFLFFSMLSLSFWLKILLEIPICIMTVCFARHFKNSHKKLSTVTMVFSMLTVTRAFWSVLLVILMFFASPRLMILYNVLIILIHFGLSSILWITVGIIAHRHKMKPVAVLSFINAVPISIVTYLLFSITPFDMSEIIFTLHVLSFFDIPNIALTLFISAIIAVKAALPSGSISTT
ncbi:MAG: hypothetical protein LBN02_02065 [Oscillospiraceae bacterium]|jgi:hypothetical protein|nr:hypothetical protein [Oscillospiraceae bacterium]